MSDQGFAHFNNQHTRNMISRGYIGKCILFITDDGFQKMITYFEFTEWVKKLKLHWWNSHEVLLSSISKAEDNFRSQHYEYQFKLVRG